MTRLWTPCFVWLWPTREQHPECCVELEEVLKLGSTNKARPGLQGGKFFPQWAFHLGQLLSQCCTTWKLSSCEWPGVPLRQTGRQAYLGLRLILESWDSAPQKNQKTNKQKNIWIPLICPDRQAVKDKSELCWIDQINTCTKLCYFFKLHITNQLC